MVQNREAQTWNERYQTGKYDGDPPIPFVNTILAELGEEGQGQLGLYVGCGNGRNYIPLVQAGLRLQGIDISSVAVSQLTEKLPEASPLVRQGSFAGMTVAGIYDYLVAIQVFQHGNTREFNRNFMHARNVLKPGGKLFLRVNSRRTEIILNHHRIENNKFGGFTIVYDEGKKKDGVRHFFDRQELEHIALNNSFDIVQPPVEVVEARKPPETGTWAQWESIWQKKA